MLLIEKILSQYQDSKSSPLLQKAKAIVEGDDVLMVKLSDGFLMARVKDNLGKIYTIHADLKQWDAAHMKCMCQQVMPCFHLIAAMMQWLKQFQQKNQPQEGPYHVAKWLDAEPEQESHWALNLIGDVQHGFQSELSLMQEQEQWNLSDIIVYLLETFSYQSLMAKSDDLILELVQANGHKLRVAWWRIKWFLENVVTNQLEIKNSKFQLGVNWKNIAKIQDWFSSHTEKHQIWTSNQAWKNMQWLLTSHQQFDLSMPNGLQAELRTYQMEGVKWLHRLYQAELGGILADDMGLGKTIQVLAYLLGIKEQAQQKLCALIVVPTTLLVNWQEECLKFTPDLRMNIFHSKQKDASVWSNSDLLLTTYGMVQRHASLFKKHEFSHIILDEAQMIKNFQSQKTKVLKELSAKQKICLSGTPMENHLGELWSLMDFTVPYLLGSRSEFRKLYQHPIEKFSNEVSHQSLITRISPFILRRSKQQVLSNLPLKTKVVQKINLESEQFELYETVRSVLADRVQATLAEKGILKSRWVILDSLLKLRQICCDPGLLPEQWNPNSIFCSAKLDYLLTMLSNLQEEGRSVVVFSQFTKMLHRIEKRLDAEGMAYQTLTGKTQNRQDLVKRFQKGEVSIFLISLRAGGLGLNLTKADTVIHYEPWWNPAVSAQATDRIYRIGQEQPVFEYHLIAASTLEEWMLSLQEKKYDLFAQTIEQEHQHQTIWTEETIMKFFAPLQP